MTSPWSFVSLATSIKDMLTDRLTMPMFVVGDMVWLLCRHIATTHPCIKLDYKKLGPFRIIERINQVAFRLTLPLIFWIHNVFHISLLKLYHPSRIQVS